MVKKRGLGLGLQELLSDVKKKEAAESQSDKKDFLKTLAIDLLKPGKYQPRQDMGKEALAELADSIRSQGIIQPIVVRPVGKGSYEIIAGERRWRAAQLARLHEVPVVVKEIPDKHAVAMSLIENIQREELNAIDTAMSLQRLINEFSMTHEGAAEAIGKSRTAVTNLLRLLSLSEEIKRMVQQNLIEMGHARALLALDVEKQLPIANIIVSKKLSVRASESLIKSMQRPKVIKKNIVDPNIRELQRSLSEKLAADVKIQHGKGGKGKITIGYNSLDELDGVLERIK